VIEGHDSDEGVHTITTTCAAPLTTCAASGDCEAGAECCDDRELCFE